MDKKNAQVIKPERCPQTSGRREKGRQTHYPHKRNMCQQKLCLLKFNVQKKTTIGGL